MKSENSITFIRDGRAPIPKSVATSRLMRANKAKNTKPEILFRKALWANGIRGYRLHWNKIPGRPDIAFPARQIAIFINGCFWHRCPHCNLPLPKSNSRFWKAKFEKNVIRDKSKIALLKQGNWRPIIFWECQIKNDVSACLSLVHKTLKGND